MGDTFTVNPYGSDDTYTLRVAGILHSMSENVVVTASYADTLKIPYTFSSLYTAVEKQDIAADDAIKSIQSKQMIMDSFDVFTEIMNLMISLMVIVAMILGIVVLYNLGVMSYTERYREMATLKVLGFRDKKSGHFSLTRISGLPFGYSHRYPCRQGSPAVSLKKACRRI